MDIRAKTVLDLVKSVDGAENAVIAGGAVRDMVYFNIPHKDVDIIVPFKSADNIKKEIKKLLGEQELVDKGEEYGSAKSNRTSGYISSKRYRLEPKSKFSCWGFEFEGVKFDLITSLHPNEENFGGLVIEDFDYGANMVYYDGIFVHDEHPEFVQDKNSSCMTLRKLDNMSDLPKMITRYNSISDRVYEGQHWRPTFKCSVLTIKKPKKSKLDDLSIYAVDPGVLVRDEELQEGIARLNDRLAEEHRMMAQLVAAREAGLFDPPGPVGEIPLAPAEPAAPLNFNEDFWDQAPDDGDGIDVNDINDNF